MNLCRRRTVVEKKEKTPQEVVCVSVKAFVVNNSDSPSWSVEQEVRQLVVRRLLRTSEPRQGESAWQEFMVLHFFLLPYRSRRLRGCSDGHLKGFESQQGSLGNTTGVEREGESFSHLV